MKEPKDIIINGKTLQEHLELHKKWLNDEEDGVRLSLCSANLTDADLSYTCLRGADLSNANLTDADLLCADLRDADLRSAYLRGADLSYAYLRDANFIGADLRNANLDFSQLNLSCRGINFKIDERLAKQLMYHIINLMQYSDLDTNKIVKKNMFKWLENSHVVTKHELPILKEAKDERR
jgi:hypothetical protein